MSKLLSIGLMTCLLSTVLFSHQRSESYSKINIDSTAESKSIEVEFSIQTSVLQRLNLNFTENWEEELTNKVIDNFNFNKNCNLSKTPFLKNSFSTGYLTLLWTMECELEESTINFELFFDEDPTHTHISTFYINSVASPEKVFTSSRREWKETDNESKSESRFDSFRDYLELGFNHILSGYDHLAFLFAILILGFALKNLIIVITGFTIGHSITLALGALGLVTPSSQFVEALIGYSIVIIALECIASVTHNHSLYGRLLIYFSSSLVIFLAFFGLQKFIIGLVGISIFSFCYLNLVRRHPGSSITLLVTSFFGLIHGFGFAGNLSSIGMMEGRLLPAIAGFNIGVELGQLLIVLVVYLILSQITKFIRESINTIRVCAASALSCLGTYWFLERLF